MPVIEVQQPGLFTTVQDLGREGFGPLGVSPAGAADPVSLRLGNCLVGNAEGAAALEMTLLGGVFRFPEGAVASLTGSDFGATLDEKPTELWASFKVEKGQVLRMGPTRSGARCYLCVHGGISVPLFLGSASTHILSGLGGFEGRALRKGDVLPIGTGNTPATSGHDAGSKAGLSGPAAFAKRKLSESARKEVQPQKVLRVTPGPQSDLFPESSRRLFYESKYRVAEESNRMGLRLEGPPILGPDSGSMISEGIALGAVQLPESGLPIILFVELQTTGGYPKMANVISADFHSLGQLRPRDEIRFEQVDWNAARNLLRHQEEFLASQELIFA